MNLEHVQPVIQIFAQVSAAHRLFRHFVGGCHHAHIDFEFGLAAQAPDFGISRMRSSLACVAAGISPISSSSSVPFCATSKHPARRSEAPVKEPFSWPNSSLSISV